MLSFMARGYFGEHELMFMPLLALLIFCGVFAFITVRALRADKEAMQALAGLPLSDDASPLINQQKGAHRG